MNGEFTVDLFRGNVNLFQNDYFSSLSQFSILRKDQRIFLIEGVDMNEEAYTDAISSIRFTNPEENILQTNINSKRFASKENSVETVYPENFVSRYLLPSDSNEDTLGMVYFYKPNDLVYLPEKEQYKKRIGLAMKRYVNQPECFNAEDILNKRYLEYGTDAILKKEYDGNPGARVKRVNTYKNNSAVPGNDAYYSAAIIDLENRTFLLEATAEDTENWEEISLIFQEMIDGFMQTQ